MRYIEIPPRLSPAAPAQDVETTDKGEEETQTEAVAADSADIDAAADADSTTETPPSEERELSGPDDVAAAAEPVVAPAADAAAGVGEQHCFFKARYEWSFFFLACVFVLACACRFNG